MKNKLSEQDIQQVKNIVYEVKDLILQGVQSKDDIHSKGYADYVTEIDLKVQEIIKNNILQLFPEHQFFGEEGERAELNQQLPCWILDPIDGTTNLVKNLKHSCVSLAFWDGNKLAYGLIYNPFLDELFEACAGGGAYLNGQKISVAKEHELASCLAFYGTSPHDRNSGLNMEEMMDLIKKVFMHTEDLRRMGSAALDFAYVACGRADLYFEIKLQPWDFAAGLLIVQEAGGIASTFEGAEIDIFNSSSVIVGNPKVQSLLLQLIRDHI